MDNIWIDKDWYLVISRSIYKHRQSNDWKICTEFCEPYLEIKRYKVNKEWLFDEVKI